MKVGYAAPLSISVVNGGLRTQANLTIEHLKKHGIEPVFISPWEHAKVNELDLIHVFGASVENSGIVARLSGKNIPIILSPIFYSNRSATLIRNTIRIEHYLSTLGSGIRSDFGIKKKLCELADLILPNTKKEANLIRDAFTIPDYKIGIVPNGIEAHFAEATGKEFVDRFGIENFVLFVGQASAKRKNVINLLKIASKIDTELVIIGSFDGSAYSKECLKIAGQNHNVVLIDNLPHDSTLLRSAYAAAKVFVLPSRFETPGIAAMEAALAGANIAITEVGGTKEYFRNQAYYLNPDSPSSIYKALEKALSAERTDSLKERLLKHYSWDVIAQKIFDHYKRVLT